MLLQNRFQQRIRSGFAPPLYSHEQPQGLIGWWPLNDGTAVDLSGFNRHGLLIGPPNPHDGRIATGLRFNGSSQYISVSDVLFPISSAPRTMAAWFNCASIPGGNACIFGYGNAGGATQAAVLFVETGSGKVGFSNWSAALQTAGSTCDGLWRHVAISIVSGGAMTLYLDGASVATGSQTMATFLIGSATIGTAPNGQGLWFPGLIDDVRLYNRALSDGEVFEIFALGSNQAVDTELSSLFPAPVAGGGIALSRLTPMSSGIIMGGFVG